MYASHLAREGRRPVMRPPEIVEVPVEGNQPPLYYHLGAWVLEAAGLEGLRVETPPLNPRSNKRGGTERAVYAHGDAAYPWRTVERATRLLRLCFLPVGALVVLSAYLAGRIVRPEDPAVALLAGGFAASVPQFTFVMGSVTNDVLANGLAALSLVLLLYVVATGRGGISGTAALGALVGLGVTAKMTLVFLVPVCLLGLWLAPGPPRRALRLATFLLAAAALAGPVLLDYQAQYGDPFGLELNRQMFPERVHHPGVRYFVGTFGPAVFLSFWGVFGHMNIHLGKLYYLFVFLTLAVLAALVRRWRRPATRPERGVMVLCAVTLLALGASMVRYNLLFPQPQGRYAFPGMVVLAILFADGASELLGARRSAAVALIGVMAALNAGLLFLVVLPAYGR